VLLELLAPVVVVDDELVVPPQGPHTPVVSPIGTSHVSPGQQSALIVHGPQFATHEPPS
jgi:hypothetical protein